MDYKQYYGECVNRKEAERRIEKLKKRFFIGEKTECEYLFSSPGRAEILGNHTDHNNGKVIVAAISCDILAAVMRRTDDVIKICSDGYQDIIVRLGELEAVDAENGTSTALVRGVIRGISDKGYKAGGFTAYITSDIFKGAGLSSSAAFEVLVAEIENVLYLNDKLTPIEKAIISQFAENAYFKKPCGLLDQSGVALGGLTKLDFETPEKPKITKLPLFNGYSLIITNTGGDHAKLTPHYAAIRDEMNLVAKFFKKTVLRDVEKNRFLAKIGDVRKACGDRAVLRAIHYYSENERVDRAANALTVGDTYGFLREVAFSGISSETNLQNCWVNNNEQAIPLATAYSRTILSGGAARVHGGGFAGSILAIVKNDEKERYVENMSALFGKSSVLVASIRPLGTVRMM